MIQLAYVGGLGLMAGPAGTHLKPDGPARVLRVHDRGNPGAEGCLSRQLESPRR